MAALPKSHRKARAPQSGSSSMRFSFAHANQWIEAVRVLMIFIAGWGTLRSADASVPPVHPFVVPLAEDCAALGPDAPTQPYRYDTHAVAENWISLDHKPRVLLSRGRTRCLGVV